MWYSHGAGQPCSQALFGGNGDQTDQGLKALADAGYFVICTDESPTSDYPYQCWGTANCVGDVYNMVQAWKAEFNLAPRGYAVCESMGGVVCWNAIYHGAVPQPFAVWATYPTYNMSNVYSYDGLAAGMGDVAAWNCSSLTACQTAWTGYDPSQYPISTFASIPMTISCSAADMTVQCSQNGQALANAINAVNPGDATFISTVGGHGDYSNFIPSALVNFFQTH